MKVEDALIAAATIVERGVCQGRVETTINKHINICKWCCQHGISPQGFVSIAGITPYIHARTCLEGTQQVQKFGWMVKRVAATHGDTVQQRIGIDLSDKALQDFFAKQTASPRVPTLPIVTPGAGMPAS